MVNTESTMFICVFIARDNEEFMKYELMKGDNEDYGEIFLEENKNKGVSWRFNSSSNLLRLIINKWSLGENGEGWDYLRPLGEPGSNNRESLAVLLAKLLSNENDWDIISPVKRVVKDVFKGDETNGNFLWRLLQGLRGEDKKKSFLAREENIYCRIFIHWGGGEREQILFYERKVSEILTFLKGDWKLYSLGTWRNNLFSVDVDKIKIPCELHKLKELEKRFSDEAGFESVKDVLTEYVIAYERKQEQSESPKNIVTVSFDAEQQKCLRAYLQSISSLDVSQFTKKLLNESQEALKSFLSGDQNSLPYCEEIVALFSQLVREGTYHG